MSDSYQMPANETQIAAEWDRILVARLTAHLCPHFIGDKAGCVKAWEKMQAAVRCLYGAKHGSVTADWCNLMVVTSLVRDIQAQCKDLDHALEILRLLRFTINWQYQPGIQNKAPYEDYLRLACSSGALVGLQLLNFFPEIGG